MGYLVNKTPASAAEANFLQKSALLLTWTILTSSNGVVYAALGDVIRAARDLANPSAWYVAQGPAFIDVEDPNTALCVQTDGGRGLRVKVSPRAGFVTGSPSVTQTPAAADEFYLLGGGTDASPTYTDFWPAAGARMQGYVADGDERQWFLSYAVGTGVPSALWFIDRPQPNPKGAGGNLLDRERIVFYAATSSASVLCDMLSADPTAPRSIFLYATPQQLLGRCPPGMLYQLDSLGASQRYIPGGASTSMIYAEPTVPELPFIYSRPARLAGTLLPGEVGDPNTCDEKGTSCMIRYGGQRKSAPVLLDSVDPVSGQSCKNATLAIGDVLLNWNGCALLV